MAKNEKSFFESELNKVDQMLVNNIIESISKADGNNWKKEWKISSSALPRNGISGKIYNNKTLLLLLFVQKNLEKKGIQGNRWFTYGQVSKNHFWPNQAEGEFKPLPVLAYSSSPYCTIYYTIEENGKKVFKQYKVHNKAIFFVGEIKAAIANIETFGITKDKIHLKWCGSKVIPLYHESQLNQEEMAKLPKFDEQKEFVCDTQKIDEIVASLELEAGIVYSDIQSNGSCFYRPDIDGVVLPDKTSFFSQDALKATAFHELVHSTGHPKRLNRKLLNSFGSIDYAKEELVAEIGSLLLCGKYGIDSSCQKENHAEYLKNWLNSFTSDKSEIESEVNKAVTKALSAVGYIEDKLSNK